MHWFLSMLFDLSRYLSNEIPNFLEIVAGSLNNEPATQAIVQGKSKHVPF
jgi:hypothetical protein